MALGLITASRLRKFRTCKRAHLYGYDMAVRAIRQGEALRFGSLFHDGLEAWWIAKMLAKHGAPPALRSALDAVQRKLKDSDGELNEFDLVKAEELLTGYDARWADEVIEVLAVECQFEAPLVNPETGAASRTYRIAGKIDAVAKAADGLVYIVEHKTTTMDATPGSEYWKRLNIDGQISMYYNGAAALGHDVAGCIYDVATRPTMRPKTATPEGERKYTTRASKLKDGTVRPVGSLHANQRDRDETPAEFRERVRAAICAEPDRYFVRGMVVRLDGEMEDHAWDTWHTARHMREVELSGRAVRNPDACVQFNRTCDYFDVCCGTASLDDPAQFTRGDSSHPELSTEAKEATNDQDQFEFNEF